MHGYGSGIGQKNGIAKTDEFDRSRVLFAGEENALRTEITMDYVIAVTVADSLRNLPQVVTTTWQAAVNSTRHNSNNEHFMDCGFK